MPDAPPGTTFTLQFLSIGVEPSAQCMFDSIGITLARPRDPSNPLPSEFVQFCGRASINTDSTSSTRLAQTLCKPLACACLLTPACVFGNVRCGLPAYQDSLGTVRSLSARLTTAWNGVVFWFHSDSVITDAGFQISYTAGMWRTAPHQLFKPQ